MIAGLDVSGLSLRCHPDMPPEVEVRGWGRVYRRQTFAHRSLLERQSALSCCIYIKHCISVCLPACLVTHYIWPVLITTAD